LVQKPRIRTNKWRLNIITFVTVIKSGPKNIDFTPSILNRSLQSGDRYADWPFGKSKVSPGPKT